MECANRGLPSVANSINQTTTILDKIIGRSTARTSLQPIDADTVTTGRLNGKGGWVQLDVSRMAAAAGRRNRRKGGRRRRAEPPGAQRRRQFMEFSRQLIYGSGRGAFGEANGGMNRYGCCCCCCPSCLHFAFPVPSVVPSNPKDSQGRGEWAQNSLNASHTVQRALPIAACAFCGGS